jgi:hypothetical protein
MTNRTIEGLREHLFSVIEGVRAGSVKVDQARVVNDLAQTLVNSAKVEIEYLRATKRNSSRFLNAPPAVDGETESAATPKPGALPNGIVGIRRHILKDE